MGLACDLSPPSSNTLSIRTRVCDGVNGECIATEASSGLSISLGNKRYRRLLLRVGGAAWRRGASRIKKVRQVLCQDNRGTTRPDRMGSE